MEPVELAAALETSPPDTQATGIPVGGVAAPEPSRSRRALLAAGVGGLLALVAGALGRPAPAAAANGYAVLIGRTNSGSATTTVSTSSGYGLYGKSSSSTGRGVVGSATKTSGSTMGVYGLTASASGDGVRGLQNATTAGSGAAVRAVGNKNDGLVATTAGAETKAAIRAHRIGATPGSVLVATSSTTGSSAVPLDTQPGAVQVVTDADNALVVYATNAVAPGEHQAIYARADGGNATAIWAANYSGGATGSCAVLAETDSPDGIAVWGQNTMGGWAGSFVGPVRVDRYLELAETTPPALPTDGARLFVRDNAGKSELCVQFPSGAVRVISYEP